MKSCWETVAEKMAKKLTYKWWVLAVVQCSMLIIGIDSTVVNLALPTISKELQVNISLSQWSISGFLLAAALTLPLAGRLSDLFGRKKIYLIGFFLFTITSLFCALASSIIMLIWMRVLQGFGAAALLANSNAIISTMFHDKQRGLAMGINNTIFSFGIALGVTLGGYLIEYFGWRTIFFINIPFGIGAILLGLFVFLENRISVSKKEEHGMDYLGVLLSILVIGGIMGGLGFYMNPIGPSYFSYLLILLGLLLLPLLIFTEHRATFPLLNMQLYKISSFSIGLVLRFSLSAINYAIVFMAAFFTQISLSYTPFQSGLVMLAFVIPNLIFGPAGGHLADKLGIKPITTIGFLIEAVALGCFIMAANSLGAEHTLAALIDLVIGMFLHGIGLALIAGPNNSSTLRAVPHQQTGVSAGLLYTIAFLGGTLSTAFCASIFPKNFQAKSLYSALEAESISKVQVEVCLLLLLVALGSAVLCLIRHKTVKR